MRVEKSVEDRAILSPFRSGIDPEAIVLRYCNKLFYGTVTSCFRQQPVWNATKKIYVRCAWEVTSSESRLISFWSPVSRCPYWWATGRLLLPLVEDKVPVKQWQRRLHNNLLILQKLREIFEAEAMEGTTPVNFYVGRASWTDCLGEQTNK